MSRPSSDDYVIRRHYRPEYIVHSKDYSVLPDEIEIPPQL